MTFHCPQCDGETKVIATRCELRVRRCKVCGSEFWTEEVEYDGPKLWPKRVKTPEQREAHNVRARERYAESRTPKRREEHNAYQRGYYAGRRGQQQLA